MKKEQKRTSKKKTKCKSVRHIRASWGSTVSRLGGDAEEEEVEGSEELCNEKPMRCDGDEDDDDDFYCLVHGCTKSPRREEH